MSYHEKEDGFYGESGVCGFICLLGVPRWHGIFTGSLHIMPAISLALCREVEIKIRKSYTGFQSL